MEVLCARACEIAGLNYTGMDNQFKKEECIVAPAVGTAILMGDYLRDKLNWTINKKNIIN